MKKNLLVLFLFFFSILLGCTKSEIENNYENLTSNSLSEKTASVLYCGGKQCHECGKCHEPYCTCNNNYKCKCLSNYGHHTDCPICGGCINGRISPTSSYCYPYCNCTFYPQNGVLECFLTAMHYVGELTGYYMTLEDMRAACLEIGINFNNGIYYYQVGWAMEAVFGSSILIETGRQYDMKELLDANYFLITNYSVQTQYGLYAHAVVVVGYVYNGVTLRYICLDPGTGQYNYIDSKDLEWKDSNGNDHQSKFLVGMWYNK